MQRREEEVPGPFPFCSTANIGHGGLLFRRSKMMFLEVSGVALATLFFAAPEATTWVEVHYAVVLFVDTHGAHARMHFVFPSLRDRLLLVCRAVLCCVTALVDGMDSNNNRAENWVEEGGGGVCVGVVCEWACRVTCFNDVQQLPLALASCSSNNSTRTQLRYGVSSADW
ncbi:hypothetical protein DQ04_04121020 [Trypanosoma grayi]|uniref:hypothetical protein n=1 Tax=Trypanosoma grayi TaxID=71804 RepID=UPI0004F42DAE|nr:hypothetical protein DQ04_04121020 [Trypanosoma grayi]KEG10144.1 hypothetical protein DQ04_04121020 [Trypanosoma grayi]